jgi:hypothetical protein
MLRRVCVGSKDGKYDADVTPSSGKDTLEVFFEKCVRGEWLGDQAVFGVWMQAQS